MKFFSAWARNGVWGSGLRVWGLGLETWIYPDAATYSITVQILCVYYATVVTNGLL